MRGLSFLSKAFRLKAGMKILTLALLMRDGKIVLAKKKRGFGMNLWNGYGGKLQEGETSEAAAVREIQEESGLTIQESQLKEIGAIDFYFEDKEEWNQHVVVYRVEHFEGEPKETEEMSPKWFSKSEIPYTEMWPGDDSWFPYAVEGIPFEGEVRFTEQGKKVVATNIIKK